MFHIQCKEINHKYKQYSLSKDKTNHFIFAKTEQIGISTSIV